MLNALFVYVYIIKIYLGKLFQFVWFQAIAEQDSSNSPHSHLSLCAHFREENLKNPDHQLDFGFMPHIHAILILYPVFAQLKHEIFN